MCVDIERCYTGCYRLRYGICVDIERCYMLRHGICVELHACDVLRYGICAAIERCHRMLQVTLLNLC